MQKIIIMGMLSLLGGSVNASEINQEIDDYLQMQKFSGSVLVGIQDTIIHHQAYGLKDVENNIPNRLDTAFPCASVTKPITATVLLGEISTHQKWTLKSPLNQLIDFNFQVNPTLEDLFHHTSGFSLYTDFTKNDPRRQHALATSDFYQQLSATHNILNPGFEYNNGNYIVLGHVLKVLTGKPYQETFYEKLFKPLGMKHSGFVQKTQQQEDYACGYVRINEQLHKAPPIDESWLGCGAGMYASAYDLYLFLTAYNAGTLISDTLQNQMRQYTSYQYGLGWTIKDSSPDSAFYHEGGISGFRTFLFHDPKRKFIIIALSNVETDIEKIVLDLILKIK